MELSGSCKKEAFAWASDPQFRRKSGAKHSIPTPGSASCHRLLDNRQLAAQQPASPPAKNFRRIKRFVRRRPLFSLLFLFLFFSSCGWHDFTFPVLLESYSPMDIFVKERIAASVICHRTIKIAGWYPVAREAVLFSKASRCFLDRGQRAGHIKKEVKYVLAYTNLLFGYRFRLCFR